MWEKFTNFLLISGLFSTSLDIIAIIGLWFLTRTSISEERFTREISFFSSFLPPKFFSTPPQLAHFLHFTIHMLVCEQWNLRGGNSENCLLTFYHARLAILPKFMEKPIPNIISLTADSTLKSIHISWRNSTWPLAVLCVLWGQPKSVRIWKMETNVVYAAKNSFSSHDEAIWLESVELVLSHSKTFVTFLSHMRALITQNQDHLTFSQWPRRRPTPSRRSHNNKSRKKLATATSRDTHHHLYSVIAQLYHTKMTKMQS